MIKFRMQTSQFNSLVCDKGSFCYQYELRMIKRFITLNNLGDILIFYNV